VQLCLVELPGRSWRFLEAFAHSVSDLADELAGELRDHATVPCAIYGHSMGSLLAHEIAVRLEAFPGTQLRKVLVSGSPAPTRRQAASPPVSRYSDAELMGLLTDMGGTVADVLADADLMRMILPRVRADYALCENYRAAEAGTMRAPITAIYGDQDRHAGQAEMVFWGECSRGDFSLHGLPGGHFFILEQEKALLALLAAELEDCRHFEARTG